MPKAKETLDKIIEFCLGSTGSYNGWKYNNQSYVFSQSDKQFQDGHIFATVYCAPDDMTKAIYAIGFLYIQPDGILKRGANAINKKLLGQDKRFSCN